jgi:hypothetical protein
MKILQLIFFVNHYNSYKREVAWFLSLIASWTTFRSDDINFIFVEMMLVSNNEQEKLNNEQEKLNVIGREEVRKLKI